MIALIVAMEKERERIVSALSDVVSEEYAGIVFFKGNYRGKAAVVAEAGIGKVAAAFATAAAIMRYSPSAVVNTGIAGGLGVSSKYDVIIVTEAWQHDFDLTAFGDPPGKYCGKSDAELVAALLEAVKGAKSGVIATGDSFVADSNKARAIAETFGAALCDMECGAIADVCNASGVPFAAIKVISDGADDNAEETYASFAARACEINADAALKALEYLP